MLRKSSPSATLSPALLIFLSLSIALSSLPGMAQQYKPPRMGLPGQRDGAGTRGPCILSNKQLMPLIPSDAFGLSATSQPTFFWYVPATAASVAEFTLTDEAKQEVYSTKLRLPGKPGVVSFKLPAQAGLKAGKNYLWQFSLICDLENPSANPYVEGTVQPIQPPAELVHQIRQAQPQDRFAIYANSGIWYDALSDLASQRCVRPRDMVLQARWSNLLKSVALNEFSQEPLISRCSQVNTASTRP